MEFDFGRNTGICVNCSQSMPGLLLVICGHEGEVEEEIWARQLGVWLYVPGLSNAPAEDLSLLCQQAYQTRRCPDAL